MNKIILSLVVLILLSFSVSGQEKDKMNEKRALEEKHIDFTKEYLWFVIYGEIEIDGHTFTNHKKECPTVVFRANLDGIAIVDTCTNTYYQHRVCNKKGCNVIHLEEKQTIQLYQPGWNYPNWQYFMSPTNNGVILDSTKQFQNGIHLDQNIYKH